MQGFKSRWRVWQWHVGAWGQPGELPCIDHIDHRPSSELRFAPSSGQCNEWHRIISVIPAAEKKHPFGNWDSSNQAFTVLRGFSGTDLTTLSDRSRFTDMLLSASAFALRLVG